MLASLALASFFALSPQVPVQPVYATPNSLVGTDDLDLAVDGPTGNGLLVWTERAVAVEGDLLALLVDSDGTPLGAPVVLEGDPAIRSFSARVGADSDSGRFLVAWAEQTAGVTRVRAVHVDAATGVAGTANTIVDDGEFYFLSALSDASSSGRHLLALLRSFDSPFGGGVEDVLQRLETPLGGLPQAAGPSPEALYTQTNSIAVLGDRFLAASSVSEPFSGVFEFRLRLLEGAGSLTLDSSVYGAGGGIAAAAAGDRFVVHEVESVTALQRRMVAPDGDALLLGPTGTLPDGADSALYGAEAVFNGESVTVARTAIDGRSLVDLDPATGAASLTALGVGTPTLGGPLFPQRLQASARFGKGGSTDSDVMLAYVNATTGSPAEILVGVYDPVGRASGLGGGCGSGRATFAPGATPGNGLFGLGLTSVQPLSPCFLVYGAARADSLCGSCVVVPDLATATLGFVGVTDGLGAARFEAPLPQNPSLVGLQLFAQWALASGSPECTAFGLDLSDALEVVIE